MKTKVVAVAREQASTKSEICGISRLQSPTEKARLDCRDIVSAVAPTTSATLKSAELMPSNPELCTPNNVKPLTKELASEAFFGRAVLLQSTVTGKAGKRVGRAQATDITVIRNSLSRADC